MKTLDQKRTGPYRGPEYYARRNRPHEWDVEPFDEFRGYHRRENGRNNADEYRRNRKHFLNKKERGRDRNYMDERKRNGNYNINEREREHDRYTNFKNYYRDPLYNMRRRDDRWNWGSRAYAREIQRKNDRNFFYLIVDKIREAWNERIGTDDWDEGNAYFNDRYRESDFDPGYRYESRYRDSQPYYWRAYKGRYYDRYKTPQDMEKIRRRYEDSRRRSNWSSAYLPQNNYR